MANELAIVADLGEIQTGFVRSTLTVGTEQVNAVVGANEIGIILGSGIDVNQTMLIEEQIKKMIQRFRELNFSTA